MKKYQALLLPFAISFLLVGCSSGNTPTNNSNSSENKTHIFSDEWSYDDDYHWHKCKDAGCSEVSKKSKHSFYEDIRNSVDATCDNDGGYDIYYVCYECGFEKKGLHVTNPAFGHAYNQITYEWSEDNSTCTAKAVCLNDQTHVIEETVSAVKQVLEEPQCDFGGSASYEATFTNPLFETQSKIDRIPQIGHDFGEATYFWNADYTVCTGKRVCKNNPEHEEFVDSSSVICDVLTVATETTEGLNRYTATFSDKNYTQQVAEVTIGATYSSDLFEVSGYSYDEDLGWACSLRRKSASISGSVIVPSRFGPTPVTSVSLQGCSNVTSVILPNTLRYIRMDDFKGCSSISFLTIPQSVKRIEMQAFIGCSFSSLTVYDTLTNIDSGAGLDADIINIKVTSMETFLNNFERTGGLNNAHEYHLLDENDNEITEVVIPDTVTEIKRFAFSAYRGITSISIGNGVISIGHEAFNHCSNLRTLNIGAALETIDRTAFDDCTYFTSFNVDVDNPNYSSESGILYNKDKTTIVRVPRWNLTGPIKIPATVNAIADYAFYKCTTLTQVISDDYNSLAIGAHAFDGCNNFTGIHIPKYSDNGLTEIGNYAFKNCESLETIYNISSSLTKIGKQAFAGCASLKAINIPSDNLVYSSENGVLLDKEQTTVICCPAGYQPNSFVLPSTVEIIEDDAFYGCSNLTSIITNYSLKSVGEYAFFGTNISAITIPNSIERIKGSAFSNCSSLSFNTYGNAKYLGNDSNNYAALITSTDTTIASCEVHTNCKVIADNAFSFTSVGCRALTEVSLPNGLKTIGNYAFAFCSSLAAITIPDSVSRIGNRAFWGCSSLASITLGNGVASIEEGTFYGCKISTITIPDSVTSIGEYALSCRHLTTIKIGKNVTVIEEGAFYDCNTLYTINFGGTKADWSAISFGELWDTNVPASVVHCSDGDYQLEQ